MLLLFLLRWEEYRDGQYKWLYKLIHQDNCKQDNRNVACIYQLVEMAGARTSLTTMICIFDLDNRNVA